MLSTSGIYQVSTECTTIYHCNVDLCTHFIYLEAALAKEEHHVSV